ncbi:MAG: hypothetical protein AAFU79_08120 [Myxococcota bacterium]
MSLPLLVFALAGAPEIVTDRRLDTLPAHPKAAFTKAAKLIGETELTLAEAKIGAKELRRLARPPASEPLLRWVREQIGRPVDLEDFIYFLDDLLAMPDRPRTLSVPASRARAYGILLHPQEVFAGKARRYGTYGKLPVDDPPSQLDLAPARDGEVPGPRWTARYQQPMTDEGKLEELTRLQPRFGRAMTTLFEQLKAQGAFTWIEAAVRPRERGFLLYGSWFVSRAPDPAALAARIKTLNTYEKDWGLDVPITWQHPDGFRATVEAARAMADTYGVDYATPRGARRSSHYGGRAVDIVAVDLPRTLKLVAPDGTRRVFDLSRPEASRDLSLSPKLIDWIEGAFGIKKLRKDYPHWSRSGR